MVRRSCLVLVAAILVSGGWNLGNALADKKGNEPGNQRMVQGTVSNSADAPVTGAVVYIKNVKTLQIRSFITKEQGSYYFHSLSPDVDYELHAEFNGAASPNKTLSSFDSRKQAIINLKLK